MCDNKITKAQLDSDFKIIKELSLEVKRLKRENAKLKLVVSNALTIIEKG